MKKIIAAILAIAILLAVSACGVTPTESDPPSDSASVSYNSVNENKKTTDPGGTESEPPQSSRPYDSVFPQHDPYGKGVGAMPGRVVWVHDPDSVEWDGKGYWWQLEHFDEAVIQKMVKEGIASLAGKTDVQSGWDALFRAHNSSRGNPGGYKSGQKIAIKTNINGAGAYGDDTTGKTYESYTNTELPCVLKTTSEVL